MGLHFLGAERGLHAVGRQQEGLCGQQGARITRQLDRAADDCVRADTRPSVSWWHGLQLVRNHYVVGILLLITPIVPALPVFKWLGVSSLWVYRAVTWTVLICSFVVALIVGGVRFWLLPNIENFRETIARELSAATKHRITIGNLEGRWSGFNLQL